MKKCSRRNVQVKEPASVPDDYLRCDPLRHGQDAWLSCGTPLVACWWQQSDMMSNYSEHRQRVIGEWNPRVCFLVLTDRGQMR